jgi:hypothetical protein
MFYKSGKSALLICFLITFLIAGCKPDLVERIQGQFHPDNRLIYQVDFTLNKPGKAFIEYWIRNDTCRRFTDLSPEGRDHHLSIYNMLPDTLYEYRIRVAQMNKIRESKIYTFKTDTLPASLPVYTRIKDDFGFDDYILLKVYFNPGALILLNRDAEIVWYHRYDSSVVRPFEFTFDRHVLSLVDSSIIEEISLEGKLLRRIDTKEHGINKIHHELFKNHEQQYIGLTYTEKVIDLSEVGGTRQDTIHADGMVIMDSLGNRIWDWDILNHADPMADDSILRRKHDWCHANSIAYDRDGNFLISFRNLNQIWKVDATKGEVIWKLGQNGDFSLEGTDWFISQHDAHIDPQGHLIMFDNGNFQRGYSRVLSLEVNKEKHVCSPVINIKLDQSQSTFRMGSVHMMDNNHMLVCSPKKLLTLSILNRQGETVWKVSGSRDSYKAFIIPKEKIENTRWF